LPCQDGRRGQVLSASGGPTSSPFPGVHQEAHMLECFVYPGHFGPTCLRQVVPSAPAAAHYSRCFACQFGGTQALSYQVR